MTERERRIADTLERHARTMRGSLYAEQVAADMREAAALLRDPAPGEGERERWIAELASALSDFRDAGGSAERVAESIAALLRLLQPECR